MKFATFALALVTATPFAATVLEGAASPELINAIMVSVSSTPRLEEVSSAEMSTPLISFEVSNIRPSGVSMEASSEAEAAVDALTQQAAEVAQARMQEKKIREKEQQAFRDILENVYDWFISNITLLGLGLLGYVALLGLLRWATGRLHRRAKAIRAEIEPVAEMRLAEAQQSQTASAEEMADLERERQRREQQARRINMRAEGIEFRADMTRAIGKWILLGILLLYFGWIVLLTRGLDVLSLLFSEVVIRQFLGRIANIILIIIAVSLLRSASTFVTTRVLQNVGKEGDFSQAERDMRLQTLVSVLNATIAVFLYAIAAFMIIQQLGMPIMPLLTGAGIAGIAIGFGAQSLVRDFIAGFFILLENQFRVGDVVKIGAISGLVEDITLRATYLRDLDGSLHIIPNGEIKTVTNMTFSWSRYVVDLRVTHSADPDEVIALLRDVGSAMRRENPWSMMMMEDPEILGLDKFLDNALVFKVLLKTKPLKQWVVGREYNRRLKYALDRAGIGASSPQRVMQVASETATPESPSSPTSGAQLP